MVSPCNTNQVTYLNLIESESKPRGRDFHPLATELINLKGNMGWEGLYLSKKLVPRGQGNVERLGGTDSNLMTTTETRESLVCPTNY